MRTPIILPFYASLLLIVYLYSLLLKELSNCKNFDCNQDSLTASIRKKISKFQKILKNLQDLFLLQNILHLLAGFVLNTALCLPLSKGFFKCDNLDQDQNSLSETKNFYAFQNWLTKL